MEGTDGMNACLLIAGVLAIAVGLVHSVLGEVLIFSRMRRGGLVPTDGGDGLRERHVRILWGSWHVVSVFGFALAAILLRLAWAPDLALRPFLTATVTVAMVVGAVLVLVATNGRHPGWVGLLGVAALTWIA
jgi:hypothetical protein